MPQSNVGGTDRLLRAVFAVLLSIVAVQSLRSGRKKFGLLAGLGALGAGFNVTTKFCGLNALLGIDTTEE